MKPQLSPLILLDFAIINSSFNFSPLISNNKDIHKNFSEYLIDIDFAIVQQEDNFRFFIKVAINQGEDKLPGYSIFSEGVAVFTFSKKTKISEEDKKSLMQYSAFSIALNSLRSFISALTAFAPFGKYILPSIDVNDIFQQKAKQIQKIDSKKKKK